MRLKLNKDNSTIHSHLSFYLRCVIALIFVILAIFIAYCPSLKYPTFTIILFIAAAWLIKDYLDINNVYGIGNSNTVKKDIEKSESIEHNGPEVTSKTASSIKEEPPKPVGKTPTAELDRLIENEILELKDRPFDINYIAGKYTNNNYKKAEEYINKLYQAGKIDYTLTPNNKFVYFTIDNIESLAINQFIHFLDRSEQIVEKFKFVRYKNLEVDAVIETMSNIYLIEVKQSFSGLLHSKFLLKVKEICETANFTNKTKPIKPVFILLDNEGSNIEDANKFLETVSDISVEIFRAKIPSTH